MAKPPPIFASGARPALGGRGDDYLVTVPRFDEPLLTRSGHEVCEELGVSVPARPALPDLIEPQQPAVTAPIEDPMVAVAHPRMQCLCNYERAGWDAARPGTWLRALAFDRLVDAVESLPDRFGFAIFDAWRPLDLQAELYDAAYADPELPPGFVSPPEPDPALPPPHLTGGTVDLSLTIDGIALGLGAGFDDFTHLARTDALESAPGTDRDLRRLLFWTMHDAGFVVLDCEWWHFEYGTRRWAAITGRTPLFGPGMPG